MKPFVMPNNAQTNNGGGSGAADIGHSTNGITIPINHEHGGNAHHQHQQQQPHAQQYYGQQQPTHQTTYMDGYGSPGTAAGAGQQQQRAHPHAQPTAQDYDMPHIMRNMGFNPDREIDMGIFPRSGLGRRLDPFATLDSYHRKRGSKHDPDTFGNDGFSSFFYDDPHFDFPQFGSMGRRRAGAAAAAAAGDPMAHDDMDFFNRVPPEFTQFMPDTFGQRRSGGAMPTGAQPMHPNRQPHQQQYYQPQPQYGSTPPTADTVGAAAAAAKTRELRDAAIQTEDPNGRTEVDNGATLHIDNLNQHGLRNTVDMGIKSAAENEAHNSRSHSAPPPEQQQQYQQQRQNSGNMRNSPLPTQGHAQFATQTTPPAGGYHGQQPPVYTKTYYPPQQQAHPQQKQQTPPPPQTPGGSYVRTIPIFVEGRSEPIINAHKEIPNQHGNAGASASACASASSHSGNTAGASARAYTPPTQQQWQQPTYPQQQQYQPQQKPQQQHRPTPLNTHQQTPPPQQQQQQQQNENSPQYNAAGGNLPPQTPHTIDSINKIQDIQRDVLDLMGRVEQFTGTRKDKHYVYLDEMLTRNLLKLDTIDTNGKESIRLARKEAIKCIQASINVLEAKAEQNAKNAQAAAAEAGNDNTAEREREQTPVPQAESANGAQKSGSQQQVASEAQPEGGEANANSETAAAAAEAVNEQKPIDATQIHEPIPLPPPEGMTAAATANESNAESPQSSTNAPSNAESGSANTDMETK